MRDWVVAPRHRCRIGAVRLPGRQPYVRACRRRSPQDALYPHPAAATLPSARWWGASTRRSRTPLRGRPPVLGPALPSRDFQRDDGAWMCGSRRSDRPARVSTRASSATTAPSEVVCDPGIPQRAPGAFGEKSVLSAPGYRPPAWLEEPARRQSSGTLGARAWPTAGDRRVVPRRRRAAAAGRPRRPGVRRARGADPLRRGDDRAGAGCRRSGWRCCPLATATSGTRPRPPTAARCARGSCRRCAISSLLRDVRSAWAPASAPWRCSRPSALAGHVRRTVHAVGELLRAPL